MYINIVPKLGFCENNNYHNIIMLCCIDTDYQAADLHAGNVIWFLFFKYIYFRSELYRHIVNKI